MKFLITTAVFTSFVVVLTLQILKSPVNPLYKDVFSFYLGARMVREGKIDQIYNVALQKEYAQKIVGTNQKIHGFLSYRNPPVFAYLFLPTASVDLATADKVVGIVNTVVSILALYCIKKQFDVSFLSFTVALFYIPLMQSILTGQFTMIFTLTLVLIYKMLKENHSVVGGILVGILSLKPQYLIYVPFLFLIAKKRSVFTISSTISLGAMYFINRLLYGPNLIFDYLNFIQDTENLLYGTNLISNYNLLATSSLINENFYVITLVLQLMLLLGILIWLYLKRNKIDSDFILVIGAIFSMTLNIHTMCADLVPMLVPILILIKNRKYKIMCTLLYLSPILGFGKYEGISALINFVVGIYVLTTAEKETEKASSLLANS